MVNFPFNRFFKSPLLGMPNLGFDISDFRKQIRFKDLTFPNLGIIFTFERKPN